MITEEGIFWKNSLKYSVKKHVLKNFTCLLRGDYDHEYLNGIGHTHFCTLRPTEILVLVLALLYLAVFCFDFSEYLL